jgi:hypothetical protein
VTTVTPLPFRPLVSRPTRTTPSPFGGGADFRQVHCVIGFRHDGHIDPWCVEYTSPPVGGRFDVTA